MAEPPPSVTDPNAPAIAFAGPRVGDRVDDRYRLEGRIGRGGGGTVWNAFDETLGESVALKIVSRRGDAERWRREVALARRISHPNVCRVFDLGESDDMRWVTMELVAGESLRHAIGGLEAGRRDAIMRQIVAGVAAIHQAGVIHRDLKPENIILAESGRAVIVDFGLAREPLAPSPVTHEGAVLGTPGYMAPEQALGQPVDERTDVYALGLVLHEIATGELPSPFAATRPARPSKMNAPAAAPPPPPMPWPPIIDRCIEVDPDARYASARDVAAALQTVGTSRRRWPMWAAALVVAGGAGAAVAVGVSAGGGSPHNNTADAAPTATVPPTAPAGLQERRLTFSEVDTQPLSVALSAEREAVAYSVGAQLLLRPLGERVATPVALPMTRGGSAVGRLVKAIGFFPGGDVAVWLRNRDNTFQVWRVGTGKPRALVTREEPFVAAVSADGAHLALARRGGVELVPTDGGEARPLTDTAAGALAFSPDGKTVVVASSDGDRVQLTAVSTAGGAARPLGDARPQPVTAIEWPRDDAIVVASIAQANTGVLERVDPSSGERALLARWPGEAAIAIDGAGERVAVVRGRYQPRVHTGSLSKKLGYINRLKPAHADGTTAVGLGGWTGDGWVIYSSSSGRSFDVVAATLSGEGEIIAAATGDLFATTLAGDHVIHRRPDDSWVSRELGGDREVGLAPAAATIRCAGDERPPCVALIDDDGSRLVALDPETGEVGRPIHTPVQRVLDVAVSRGGKHVALVDGGRSIHVVEIASGRVTAIETDAHLHSIAWAADDGSLIVGATHRKGDAYALLRVVRAEKKVRALEDSNHQRYIRAAESRDGEDIAVETIDYSGELWVLSGF